MKGGTVTDIYDTLGVSRTASQEDIREAYLTRIRNVHPDITGGSDDAAKNLNAAYNVLSDPDQRAAYDASLRGEECPWCGAHVKSSDVDAHVMSHMAEAARNGCAVCGRQPAGNFSFKANSGFILARRLHRFDGKLCATCVTGVFREMQAHNITRGPWGLFSLVMTPFYLIGNVINYASRNKIGTPKPYDRAYDSHIGLGRPLLSRVGVWLVIGLIAFLGYSVIQEANSTTAEVDNPGSSSEVSDPDAGWVVGACGDIDPSGMVGLTPCTGPHDAEIIDVRITETSCPLETDFYVDLEVGVACFVET